jgi:hypothetical protein
MVVKSDPSMPLIVTNKSWPLAIQLVDENDQPIGIAEYQSRNANGITYKWQDRTFILRPKGQNDAITRNATTH